MDRAQEHFHDELLTRTRRLLGLLSDNAPKPLIASELTGLFRAGLGYCGPELTACLAERLIADVRVNSGFCKACANPAVRDGYCEQCEARREADLDAAEREQAELSPEQLRLLEEELREIDEEEQDGPE